MLRKETGHRGKRGVATVTEEFGFVRREKAIEKSPAVEIVSGHAPPAELRVGWRWPRLLGPESEVVIAEGHLKVKEIRFERTWLKSAICHRLLLL